MEPTDPALLEKVQKTKTLSKELKDKVLSGEIAVTDAIIEHGVSREAGMAFHIISQLQLVISRENSRSSVHFTVLNTFHRMIEISLQSATLNAKSDVG